MATAYHNLSDYDFNSVPDASEMRFGIVVSEWNSNITGALLEGAVKTLKKHVVLTLILGPLHIPICDGCTEWLQNLLSNQFQGLLKRLQYIHFQRIRQ